MLNEKESVIKKNQLEETTDRACLLLHGLGGTPFEIASLIEPLKAAHIHTSAPLLPGHGTSITDFRTTFFSDWLHCADKILKELLANYRQVYVVGFSMGGVLAMTLASRYPVAGVSTFATPFCSLLSLARQKKRFTILLTPLRKHIMPVIYTRLASQASRAIAPFHGYEGVFCLPQFLSMMQGIAQLRKEIHNCTCPALLVHDLHDKIVPVENTLMLAQVIKSKNIQLHFTHIQEQITNHHMLLTHQETQKELCALFYEFIMRN